MATISFPDISTVERQAVPVENLQKNQIKKLLLPLDVSGYSSDYATFVPMKNYIASSIKPLIRKDSSNWTP